MLKIAVIDDEKIYCNDLKTKITNFFESSNNEVIKDTPFEVVSFTNPIEFIEKFAQCFQIIFLDIDMPQISGLNVANSIRKVNESAILIFATNYSQFALDGYKYHALDYLVKPIDTDNLSIALNKSLDILNKQNKSFIIISTNDGKYRINLDEIYYIESNGKFVNFHLKERTITQRNTLTNVINSIPKDSFLKCNCCFYVNPDVIKGIKEEYVVLFNNEELKISRSRKKEFLDELNSFYSSKI